MSDEMEKAQAQFRANPGLARAQAEKFAAEMNAMSKWGETAARSLADGLRAGERKMEMDIHDNEIVDTFTVTHEASDTTDLPFTGEVPVCPKCQGKEGSIEYCDRRHYNGVQVSKRFLSPRSEHLDVVCGRCGHLRTMQTADNAPEEVKRAFNIPEHMRE